MFEFYAKQCSLSIHTMKRFSAIISQMCTADGSLNTDFKHLQEKLKEQSLGFWIILIALPSALPIPAPGYSTPLGLLLLWIGSLLVQNKDHIHLPEKWVNRKFSLPPKLTQFSLKLLKFIEYFIYPKRCMKLCHIFNKRIIGINICLLACIMALPIPFTSTAPAGLILLFGLGLLEGDGLFLLMTQILSAIIIGLYAFSAFWIISFGIESFQKLFL